MAHNSMLALCLCRNSRPRQEVCQNAESCLDEILSSYIMHTLAGSLPDSGFGALAGTGSPAGSGRCRRARWGPFSAPGYHSASRAKRPGHPAAAAARSVATALAGPWAAGAAVTHDGAFQLCRQPQRQLRHDPSQPHATIVQSTALRPPSRQSHEGCNGRSGRTPRLGP